jgi:hypothetical protein
MSGPEDIDAVQINREAACTCGHHPLEHDLRGAILTGGNAKCDAAGCDCPNFHAKPGTPPMLTLLDKAGDEVKP